MVALFQQMPELVLEQLHSIKRYRALGLNMSNKPHIFIAEDMGLKSFSVHRHCFSFSCFSCFFEVSLSLYI